MAKTAQTPPQPAKSVTARALSVLGAFHVEEPELTLSQISRATGLPVATVFRLAGELEEGGFLQRGPSGKYSLGVRLWEMGLLTPVHGHLREVAMPFLLNLQYATRETVQLAVCDGVDAVYVEKLTMATDVPVQSRIGARIPLHATAVGQAMLAHSTPAFIDRITELPLTKYTEHTLTSKRAVLKALETVRADGVARSREEYLLGSTGIAAPVIVDGRVEAAIGLVNYQLRDDLDRFVPELLAASAGLAHRLAELNRIEAAG
ncbi:MAG: IclR family transcriptional regulator [Microbacteriaceae bacterium]